jgi:hypothetical protein
MKLAIMQPYFLPYIGYFQLMAAVDKFVLYDRIQFTKRGWIQRNRILLNGRDEMFSLPLQKGSDFLDICDRQLAASFSREREKLLRRINAAYRKAPYFEAAISVVETCLYYEDFNLFNFILHSLECVRRYLSINTELKISSEIAVDNQLQGQKRVIAICKTFSAEQYINAIGGIKLYSKAVFADEGISLFFIRSHPIIYKQFSEPFVANLSILDLMMFNPPEKISEFLTMYDLI